MIESALATDSALVKLTGMEHGLVLAGSSRLREPPVPVLTL